MLTPPDSSAIVVTDAAENRKFEKAKSNRGAPVRIDAAVALGMTLGLPDHKINADFRKDNGKAIRQVCLRFVALCRQMNLLTGGTAVVDGSKFKAVNNRDRNFNQAKMARRLAQIEESIARYLQQLDSADRQEPSEAMLTKTTRLKDKIGRLRQEVDRIAAFDRLMRQSPDGQVSLTDPDARSMATSGRGSGMVGYNVQVVVETEHNLIVTHEVTNVGNNRAHFAPMAKAAQETLGAEDLHVIADCGHFDGEQVKDCVEAALTITLPKPQTSGSKAEGRFGKPDFVYLSDQDTYRCPAGAVLAYHCSNVEKGMELRR